MDIVLRAALAFAFIFFLTRIVGRRELSSLEPFDLILLIVLGDLVQQGVTQSDYSVTGLILAAGTIAMMQAFVAYLNFRFKRVRLVLDGEPIVVVEGGGGVARRRADRADRGRAGADPQRAPRAAHARRARGAGAPEPDRLARQ